MTRAQRRVAKRAPAKRKAVGRPKESALDLACRERDEALAFQAATDEILGIIGRSPADTKPVFDAIVRSAMKIFGGLGFGIALVEEGGLLNVAEGGNLDRRPIGFRLPLTPESTAGLAILGKKVVAVADVMAAGAPRLAREHGRAAGFRSIAAAPMLRAGKAVGAIGVMRRTPGPWSKRHLDLLRSFAAQAVIAIENARLFNETKEALERQTATGEILRVIAGSPTDVQPVFDSIIANAVDLCRGLFGAVYRYEDGLIHLKAWHNFSPEALETLRRRYPQPPADESLVARCIRTASIIDVPDINADASVPPGSRSTAEALGYRSQLTVPLLRDGAPIGAIVVAHEDPGRFPSEQVRLLRTFADQAVIAIENVRLFNETKEALERQTATSDVLKVISSTPTDPKPVFDAIVQATRRIFDGMGVGITLVHDKQLHLVAFTNPEAQRNFPMPLDRQSTSGIAILERRAINIADAQGPDAPSRTRTNAGGFRAVAAAPLIREGEAVGALLVTRRVAGALSDRQLSLLQTFADQAVIAIENARLFNETKEALEKQTATADILQVLSGSPSDTQPVFDAIVRHAARLCDSTYANVFRYDGERIHLAASQGGSAEALAALRGSYPASPNRKRVVGRVVETGRVIHVEDTLADPEYDKTFAGTLRLRRLLGVPLVRGERPVGAITVGWADPGPISKRHEDLLKTFADQAVIAIENVRLFNETKEALEQQTATAEILKVISSSPTDVQPVFDAIVLGVSRLFGRKAALRTVEADGLRRRARSYEPEPGEYHGRDVEALDRRSIVGQAVLEGRALQWRDTLVEGAATYGLEEARKLAFRSIASAPLMRGGRAIGVISVSSPTPGLLTASQMELLTTFADQAVIAIENVRLFNETKEALERQTATADVLKVISESPTNVAPVFDAILKSAVALCGAELAAVFAYDGNLVHMVATHNWSEEALRYFSKIYPSPPSPKLLSGRTILTKSVVQITDSAADPEYDPNSVVTGHWRRMLGAPMLREGKPLGVLVVAWREPGETPQRQVDLLQTFADQAAIAIENVRLFNETKEALDQQKASAEVLGAISGSIADTKPVFEKILASCERLFEGELVGITLADGDTVRLAAYHGPRGEQLEKVYPLPLTRESGTGWAILNAQIAHFPDIEANGVPPGVVAGCRTLKVRAIVFAPMLFEGKGIGAIWVARAQPGAFTDKQIAQLRTFADQAVIAIQNARLVNETREALDQQKASAEVLRVISGSVADTTPVFETILLSCERLFAGLNVGINVVGDDGKVHIAAYHGHGRDELERHFPVPLSEASGSGAAIMQRAVVHYPDVEAPGVPEYARRGGKIAGNRSVIFAPMLWEEKAIGAIFVGRDFTGPFSEKEIALLRTFADQAAIAIQNARLFREIQEKSAQLEVANKHKSDFLANMSHELRTPLNAIIGFSEVLSERMFGEVNEKQAEYLKDIHESGRHLLSLINDILDLSKIEAGRMELELSSFDLPDAVSNAMTLVRERAQRHGIQLGLEMDPALGELQADERKVKQILLNLLSNAVKFTPDGGRVDVSARAMNGKIEIAVRDTGIGIAAEDHAAVFEEFKQVGRDYTRKAEGTGLGLALTKRLVELHGGEISLESALGKGATFTVKLPLR